VTWDKVRTVLGTIAPWIAGSLGTPATGAAVKLLCDAFGLAPGAGPDAIGAAIASATPDQLMALRMAEMKHQEFMQQLGYQHVEQLAATDASDRASARDREIRTGDKWTPRAIAGMVVVCYFAVQWFVLDHVVPAEMRDIVMRTLGTLDAALGMVLNYYYGGSHDAAQQQQQQGGAGNG